MKIYLQFGYGSGDGGRLAERLGLAHQQMEVEASTARQVFEHLYSQSPVAKEIIEIRFSFDGIMSSGWVVIVNRGTPDARYIKSIADLDAPLQEGDRIYLTSASAGG